MQRDRHRAAGIARQRYAFAGASSRHTPIVTGRLGFMNDQGTQRTAPRRLFVLVGPAPVIGHATVAETPGNGLIGRSRKVRVVHQEHGNLAGQVDVAIVVPVALRRRHPEADKHQGDIPGINTLRGAYRAYLNVFTLHQLFLTLGVSERQLR